MDNYLREKYLKEDKETLVERILILQKAYDDLLTLVADLTKEIKFKTRELEATIKEMY